jgi:hypothetical protein
VVLMIRSQCELDTNLTQVKKSRSEEAKLDG